MKIGDVFYVCVDGEIEERTASAEDVLADVFTAGESELDRMKVRLGRIEALLDRLASRLSLHSEN